jgi:hypothetical protein
LIDDVIYWVERKEYKKGDIQAASETLRQIDEMSIDMETGEKYGACGALEKMLYYAADENKIDKSQIRDSKIIQHQLQVIRIKEGIANRELREGSLP